MIIAIRIIVAYKMSMLTQGRKKKKTAGTHNPLTLRTDSLQNPESSKDRDKLREWWVVTGGRSQEEFLAF